MLTRTAIRRAEHSAVTFLQSFQAPPSPTVTHDAAPVPVEFSIIHRATFLNSTAEIEIIYDADKKEIGRKFHPANTRQTIIEKKLPLDNSKNKIRLSDIGLVDLQGRPHFKDDGLAAFRAAAKKNLGVATSSPNPSSPPVDIPSSATDDKPEASVNDQAPGVLNLEIEGAPPAFDPYTPESTPLSYAVESDGILTTSELPFDTLLMKVGPNPSPLPYGSPDHPVSADGTNFIKDWQGESPLRLSEFPPISPTACPPLPLATGSTETPSLSSTKAPRASVIARKVGVAQKTVEAPAKAESKIKERGVAASGAKKVASRRGNRGPPREGEMM